MASVEENMCSGLLIWGGHYSRAVQEGGESLAAWMPRPTEEEFERVAKVSAGGLIVIPDAEDRCGEGKLLRPNHRVSVVLSEAR